MAQSYTRQKVATEGISGGLLVIDAEICNGCGALVMHSFRGAHERFHAALAQLWESK